MALQTFYNGVGKSLRLFTRIPAVYSGNRQLVPSLRFSSSLSKQFDDAKNRLSSLSNDPGNEVKLQMYALYKQATSGKCSTKQPGVFDIVGRAKWSAWNALGNMTVEDAQKQYVDIVANLTAAESSPSASAPTSEGDTEFKSLLVTREGPIRKVVLNRPDKKNAIDLDMFAELKKVLNDDSELVTVITGAGDYYCSGNDLGNFMALTGTGKSMSEMAKIGGDLLREYVASFIDYPKILVALVNGPAVGMAVSVLPLFDLVLASDKATFHTPFTTLGQSPEGTSSYLFPILMGSTKASEVLLFNRKLSAKEAEARGLVTEVFADHCFQKEAWDRIKYIASLPPQSVVLSKQLTRKRIAKELHNVNNIECELLLERWQSDECLNAISSFMQKKSKL